MNLQVNLIKASEVRNNAAINPRLVAIAACCAGALLVCLIVLKAVVGVNSEKSRLAVVNQELKELDAEYLKAQAVVSKIDSRRNILSELDRWRNSAIQWAEPMRELQDLVPNPVQLTKLNVQGSHRFIEETSQTEAGTEEITDFRQVRMYKITLNGRVTGERGDQVVLNFVRNLPKGKEFKPLLESAKLQKMQRDPYAKDDDPVRLFAIEGHFYEREL